MKYKVVLKGEDGKTYYENRKWAQSYLGIDALSVSFQAKAKRDIENYDALTNIFNPIIVEFYKQEIYALLLTRKKQFRENRIISKLSHSYLLNPHKYQAFAEMVKDGEILEGSRGWYKVAPDLIFDLKSEVCPSDCPFSKTCPHKVKIIDS